MLWLLSVCLLAWLFHPVADLGRSCTTCEGVGGAKGS